MRARVLVAGAVVLGTIAGVTAVAVAGGDTAKSFKEVRAATARFHSTEQAEKAGYEPFLECIDSDAAGMGQHFVNRSLIEDPEVVATQPEALVYEVKGDALKLVGVEYIVPVPQDEDAAAEMRANPPRLFGQPFHEVTALEVMVLHAWVWRDNPGGAFEDFNPDVAPCPADPSS